MGALRFEGFALHVSRPLLMRDGRKIPLRPQALKVLVYLAEQRERVVSNDELVRNCWEEAKQKDTHANSVAQCIKEIREALGKTKQEVIRTVPRQGYVFAAPASSVTSAQEPASSATQAAARAGALGALRATSLRLLTHSSRLVGFLHRRRHRLAVSLVMVALLVGGGLVVRSWLRAEGLAELTMMEVPSIAVLPFQGAANGREEGTGDAGLADEISSQLLRVPRGFRILVRSASAYKDKITQATAAGRELGVRYVVTGGVRGEGDVVHLNIQLIEAQTGRQLWAQPFGYRLGEPGARNRAAHQVARLITERLTATEAGRPLPAEPKADHYAIMGRAAWAGERDGKVTLAAMALFKKGVDLDPNSVPSLQGYARAKISAVLEHHAPEEQRLRWLEEAEKAIDRVIAQRRKSYGAYRLRGSLYRARGEWEKAVKAFELALKINSDYAEAQAELGRVKMELGLAEEALTRIEKAIALSPTDAAGLSGWHLWAGQAALHLGDYQRALDRLLEAEQANHANDDVPPWLALAYAGLGQWGKARTVMVEYLRGAPAFTVAAWKRDNPPHNAAVAAQREHIASMLRELGVPDGQVRTGSAR